MGCSVKVKGHPVSPATRPKTPATHLPLDIVDIKAGAVDATEPELKLVVRQVLR